MLQARRHWQHPIQKQFGCSERLVTEPSQAKRTMMKNRLACQMSLAQTGKMDLAEAVTNPSVRMRPPSRARCMIH